MGPGQRDGMCLFSRFGRLVAKENKNHAPLETVSSGNQAAGDKFV